MHEKKAVRIRCTAAATLPLDELTGMQGALKTLSPENEGKLRKQILEAGFRAPIFVWKDGKKHRILDGHQRLTVLTKLQKEGYNVPPLPVAYIEADNEKDAYRTVLSFASAYGQMTNDGLLGFMELSGIDFETIETDFRLSEIDLSLLSGNAGKVEEEVFDAEAAAAAIKEPISKRGDLYALGTHRLLCGDATGGGDVDRLMGGEKADMVFTDPPYGMNLDTDYSAIKGGETRGKKHRAVFGDDEPFDPSHLFQYFGYCDEILLFGADYFLPRIPDWEKGTWLIWDKRVEERYDKVIGSAYEVLWSKKKRRKEILRFEYVTWGSRMADGEKVHPTMKPVGLIAKIMGLADSERIVDVYGGSGTTLIAAEKLGRRCFMMEIDPIYCDVIVQRWETLTGKKAELLPATS
jgi:DNA modification methylase